MWERTPSANVSVAGLLLISALSFIVLPMSLFYCFWLRRKSSRSNTTFQTEEENVGAVGLERSAPITNSEQVRRQPLRHHSDNNNNGSPLMTSGSDKTKHRSRDLKVDVSYKDNGAVKLAAVHDDRSNMIVPSQMSEEETRSLLKAMMKFTPDDSTAVLHCCRAPTVSRVITYGVSDEITRRDKSPPFRDTKMLSALSGGSSHKNGSEIAASITGSSLSSCCRLEPLLVKLILNGPRRFPFDYFELKDLLERGTKVFASEPSLLEAPVPCVVYGDIHGQYSDLHRWLNLNGWPNQSRSVFLGDFVDRGSHGVEVVALITALKLTFPRQIFVIRGNHEEESLNKNYSFYTEVCQRFGGNFDVTGDRDGSQMYSSFKKLFMHLPLAVIIGYRVLGVHGGISPKLMNLQDIRNIERPIDDFDVGTLECDLVWSDPDVDAKTEKTKAVPFRPNFDREPVNGIGQLFNAESVKRVCKQLHIDMVIRGHQTPLHGYAFFADGRMITLFSAPGYKGTTNADVNMAAAIEFDRDMRMTIKKLKVSEQFRRNRIADCEKRSSNPTLSLTTIGTPAAAKAATTSGSGTAKVTNKGC